MRREFQSKRRRTNVEGDRLSSLPDDLIAKILSYNDIKQAVETSVLSSRWKSIWTTVPYLNFSTKDFSNNMPKFYNFLTSVFSSCIDQVEFSLNLRGEVSQVFIKKILNYVFSRNIQKLTFTVLHDNQIELDLSLISSQSLKHLSLFGSRRFGCMITPTSMWELPALTTLHLNHVTLYDIDDTNKCVGLFSKCVNLKNLTFNNCSLLGSGSFTVCHPHISKLTLKNITTYWRVINVFTPQLKNLTIIDCVNEEPMISAPNLISLKYKNSSFLISVDVENLPTLENLDLCIRNPHNGARELVDLLQNLNNVKFLTLNLEIIKILSASAQLIRFQPSPFVNLKSLRIYPGLLDKSLKGEVNIPTELKKYVLDSSPSATLTMVSRKVSSLNSKAPMKPQRKKKRKPQRAC